jgi:hypothetical protein
MTTLRKLILIGALLAAAPPSIAEDAHHPDTAAEPAPPAALPTPGGQPGMGAPGMMSEMMSGMMGPGMMGPGMMSMMSMMSMMASMGQMMAPEHIEGRLAFLRTELRITEAQQPLWDAFADALRANARSMAGAMAGMQGMTPQPPRQAALPQRVELQERMLAARLDGLRKVSAALQPLYATLDDAQKRTADTLVMVGPMGLM